MLSKDCIEVHMNNNLYKFYKISKHLSGSTSNVYVSEHKEMIMKHVTMYLEYNVYEREKCMLQFFNTLKIDWCPTLYHYDDTKRLLIMSYCGEMVNTSNKPIDLRKQLEGILYDLKCFNIQHNDIKESEILIKDGKVYICDYGWCSINNELACDRDLWNGEKPCNIYKDDTLFKRLEFLL